MEHLIRPWRLYGETAGRATRREFLAVHLTVAVAVLLALAIPSLAAPWLAALGRRGGEAHASLVFALLGFVLLFAAAPFAAVYVRRLHDIARSGWWLVTLPCGGTLLLLVLPGTPGANRYGSDPRRRSASGKWSDGVGQSSSFLCKIEKDETKMR